MDNLHHQLDNVEHTGNEFIQNFTNDYEYLLINKEWYCLPTICFGKNNTPFVLTCKNHHEGEKKLMIHTPQSPKHILPSMYLDQLAHTVIHCRTLNPIKTTQYSTRFQLFEQKGTFNGIDNFSMTDFQNMEITSPLLSNYDSLEIVHRSDTN